MNPTSIKNQMHNTAADGLVAPVAFTRRRVATRVSLRGLRLWSITHWLKSEIKLLSWAKT